MGEMLKEMPKQPANQYSAFSQVEEIQTGQVVTLCNRLVKNQPQQKLELRNIPTYSRVELNLRKEDILKPIAKENQGTRTDIHQNSDGRKRNWN